MQIFRNYSSPTLGIIAAGILSFLPSISLAQTQTMQQENTIVPPVVRVVDDNGVDLVTGQVAIPTPEISTAGISYKPSSYSVMPFTDNLTGNFGGSSNSPYFVTTNVDCTGSACSKYIVVNFQGQHKFKVGNFTANSNPKNTSNNFVSVNYEAMPGSFGSVSCVSVCTYTATDGTLAVFSGPLDGENSWDGNQNFSTPSRLLGKVIKPDGEVINYYYQSDRLDWTDLDYIDEWHKRYAIITVQSNLGWTVKYDQNYSGSTSGYSGPFSDYYITRNVYIFNSSLEYCDNYIKTCNLSQNYTWPKVNFEYNVSTIIYKDAIGEIFNQHYTSSGSPTVVVNTNSSGSTFKKTFTTAEGRLKNVDLNVFDSVHIVVSKVKKSGNEWSYAFSRSGNLQNTTVIDGFGNSKLVKTEVVYDYHPYNVHTDTWGGPWDYRNLYFLKTGHVPEIKYSRVQSIQNELGHITRYKYNSQNLVTEVINADATNINSATTGGQVYTYDDRGNATSLSVYPKGGGAPITTQASYPSSCTEVTAKVCNKPVWTRDALGRQADYTYDSLHGGVLTETGPADANGVRPQTRYTYTPLYAKVKNASGTLVNAEGPIYKLTKVSTCLTATSANPASCVGTVDEQVKEYAYNHNNLLMTSETIRNGNSTVSATTGYAYDYVGNVVIVDGPRTDVDDTTYKTYDTRRRLVFEIGAYPDNSGTLKRQTVKHHYDLDGLEVRTETGTCGTVTMSGGIPTGCSDFVWTSAKKMTYDAAGRLTKTEVVQP